jgi:tRNA threonylcarbamoyladenosine biosynthesis protein TsaB
LRILAIETSGTSGSVAACDAGSLLTQIELDPAGRSARTLAPGIRELLRQVAWTPKDVQLVAVAIGPGSFTGLRLGVMTAKAFAYAVGAQIVGIGTLEAIAARAPAEAAQLATAIDAQRGEVYAGAFSRDQAGQLSAVGDVRIVESAAWLAALPPGIVVTGPALVKLAEQVPPRAIVAPRSCWSPDATAIGRLAAARSQHGMADDLWTLAPLYLRRSAAEEKWDIRST